MHVLWIKTDLLFPLNSGGRIRTFEMLRAIRLFFEWEHLLAEPAGAAALAALLYRYNPAPAERVVVLLSGANVTDEVMVQALTSR